MRAKNVNEAFEKKDKELAREELLFGNGISIKFGDWLSKNYNIENGIGWWSDHTSTLQYPTYRLWEIFLKELEENES